MLSPIDVPAHDNSAMDGYAVRSADAGGDAPAELRVIGTSWAGRPFPGETGPGECVRIMTGAVMPSGTDAVVIQENAEVGPDSTIRFRNGPAPATTCARRAKTFPGARRCCVRGSGSARRSSGCSHPLERSKRASGAGCESRSSPTGDELRSLGEPLDAGCVYDSNRYTLLAMLRAVGAEILDLGVVPDVRREVEQAFREAAAAADAIITSGGVSVGEADFVKETLERSGEVDFWKIAMKPGRPLAFGKVGNALFFGLPGNPVSVMVTFYQFVQPALRRMMGEPAAAPIRFRVPCTSRLRKRPGREEFQRGVLGYDDAGRLTVRSTGGQGSGILSSMHEANCFIVLPLACDGVEPGNDVDVEPFGGVTGPGS